MSKMAHGCIWLMTFVFRQSSIWSWLNWCAKCVIGKLWNRSLRSDILFNYDYCCVSNCDVCHPAPWQMPSTRFVGKPEEGSSMYFWFILTIFRGSMQIWELRIWEAPEDGYPPPPNPRPSPDKSNTANARGAAGVETMVVYGPMKLQWINTSPRNFGRAPC